MAIGKSIKIFADARNWTLKQVSAKSGVSYNTIYAIVSRDNKTIKPEIAEKIAKAFGVSVPMLLHAGRDEKEIIEEIQKYNDHLQAVNFITLCKMTSFLCEEYNYKGIDGYKITENGKPLFISKTESNEIIETIKGSFWGLLGHKLCFSEEIIPED